MSAATRATFRSWPLSLLFLALPLWWVLGLFALAPLLLAIPMAAQLLRSGSIRLPPGFGWWMLFLLWVLLGAGVLWAQAPGSVPDGGPSRLLVFGYRAAWYLACTTVLLWLTNAPRSALPDSRVLRTVSALFAVTALGGVLGVVRPDLELRSALELVLPHSLAVNDFVSSLVHPAASEVQSVLGHPEPRPKAPFAFTNSWGSGLALSAVFCIAAVRRSRLWVKAGAGVLFALAVTPALYSLDRGLWLTALVGVLGFGVLQALTRRPRALAATAVVAMLVLAVTVTTPLAGIVEGRWQNQHSNDRRGQLMAATVRSVSTGSPVVGFGSTRDVQGSFASISGAATPSCPACGVPPLGTQGQLWLILFSQGWIGLAFFVIFVVLALVRCWRCRTPNETVCTFVVAFFLIQLPIYDSLGLPLYLVMVAVGLVAREQLRSPPADQSRRRPPAAARPAHLVAPVALMALGAGAGTAAAAFAPRDVVRTITLELAPTPVHLDSALDHISSGQPSSVRLPQMTVDTEAALLRSQRTLAPVARRTGQTPDQVLRATSLAAVPNSRVLLLAVSAPDAATAVLESDALARAYLRTRSIDLRRRRDDLVSGLQAATAASPTSLPLDTRASDAVASAIADLTSSSDTAGTVVRRSRPHPAGDHRAVWATSGAGLGLLLGLGLLRRRTRA